MTQDYIYRPCLLLLPDLPLLITLEVMVTRSMHLQPCGLYSIIAVAPEALHFRSQQ